MRVVTEVIAALSSRRGTPPICCFHEELEIMTKTSEGNNACVEFMFGILFVFLKGGSSSDDGYF